jgi:hypothetical protein
MKLAIILNRDKMTINKEKTKKEMLKICKEEIDKAYMRGIDDTLKCDVCKQKKQVRIICFDCYEKENEK